MSVRIEFINDLPPKDPSGFREWVMDLPCGCRVTTKGDPDPWVVRWTGENCGQIDLLLEGPTNPAHHKGQVL